MASLSGGAKLATALRGLVQRSTRASAVEVGFLAGATYPDGTSVALVAAVNEFGRPDKGQPPRPFFRAMIAAKSPAWPDTVAKLLKANRFDAARTLAQAGDGIKGQLQQSIVDLTSPALKPATVAAKGFDKPLVDTGHMLNSVDYAVKR